MIKYRLLPIMFIVIGFALAVGVGAFFNYFELGYLKLTSQPRSFGEITVWAKHCDEDETMWLYMAKDGITFLAIDANETGEIESMSLVAEDGETVRFTMSSSNKPGRWEQAIYAHDNGRYTTEESCVDIDFDGQFDVKNLWSDTGQLVSSYIYAEHCWKKVDGYNYEKAMDGQDTYIFKPDLGWEKQ